MKKEQFLALLSKKLAGEPINNALLDEAIKNNEEFKQLNAELTRYFNDKHVIRPKADRAGKVWEMIGAAENNELNERFNYAAPKRGMRFNVTLVKVAAMLLLFIAAGLAGRYLLRSNTGPDFSTVASTTDKSFKMLDDGTKIWLNKRSLIRFNKAFGKQKREIFLEGEAFFDVVKNSKVPLIIHVGNVDIEVKGTAFNVNAYRENAQIQVALVRGLIQVTNKLDSNYKLLLRPNEKLIYNKHTSAGQNNFVILPLVSNVLLSETKWVADTLIFRKEKLKDLVVRMEKKYDLKIEIQSQQLKEKRFSGTFTNETILEALDALKLSYPLTYTINNRLVLIKD